MCRDPAAFAALAPEWAALFARCRTATPFQHHAWLHSWWRSYGRPGRLRVVLVREAGRLVAAAPLTLVHRPWPTLVPLGGPLSDHADVLLDDDRAEPAARALAAGIAAAGRGALVDLREVRPGAAAERVYALWPGPRRRLADAPCLELPALALEDLVARLARPRAQRVRAKLRKLDALGVHGREVPVDEVPRALRTLLALHRLQWQDRKVTGEHLRPRFAAHLERAVVAMVRSGHAVVTEFRLPDRTSPTTDPTGPTASGDARDTAGTTVAVDLTLLAPGLTGAYLYGAHPRLRAGKVDVATMLLRSGARLATRDGAAARGGVLSLLRGDEPYKHHWKPAVVTNRRLLLARRRALPLLVLALGDAGARDLLRRARHVRRARTAARTTPPPSEPGGGAHACGGP
ncbi:GNAT family N-acetyltransferase [Streptomyces sp. LE64]|uniref:GNAT family N-acetyltransferase n=1 Tax=Streptomyces sp. LE64 TaxID=3448653 RepID=UPI0040418ADA